MEDVMTDWVEEQASLVVTEAMLYSSAGHNFSAGVKLHKLTKVSEAIKHDAAFARQLKRKYLPG